MSNQSLQQYEIILKRTIQIYQQLIISENIIINLDIIRNQQNKYLNRMLLSSWNLISYLLLLVQIVGQLRICLYSDSTNTQFINLQHQLKQQQKQSCIACLPTCKSCTSVTDQSCANGNCQSGYYFNTEANKCKRCKKMCEECTSYQVCAKCIDGYYFDFENNCKVCPRGVSTCTSSSILECMDGFYYDSQAYLCRKCSDPNCIACSAKLQCDICQSGYILNGSASGCLKCGVLNCQKCSTVSTCQSCMVGYQLISNNFCTKYVCSSINKCKQCRISNNITLCTLCQPGFFLLQNSCHYGTSMMCEYSLTPQMIIQQGFSYVGNANIFNLLTDYGSCATCNTSISRKAANTQSFCIPKISQEEDITYRQFFVFNQHLICTVPYMETTTPDRYFRLNHDINAAYQLNIQIFVIILGSSLPISSILNKSVFNMDININNSIVHKQIQPYQLFCLDPSIPSNTIIAKYSSTYKILTDYTTNSTNNSQIQKLQLNLSLNTQIFGNSSSIQLSIKQLYFKLSLCTVQNCLQCLSASSCTKCYYPYLVQNFQCVIVCDVGYYMNNVTRKCLSECQFGYYPNLNLQYVCTVCPLQCLGCTSVQYCYKCSQGYYLTVDGRCSINCTISSQLTQYYPNTQTAQCKRCQNPCKTCSLVGRNCTTCMIGFQMYNNSVGQCVFECPVGYFSKVVIEVNGMANPSCKRCSGSCKACQMNMSSCISCNNGLYLYNNLCLLTCPYKYYGVLMQGQGAMCKQCMAPCNTCQRLQNNCTTCRYNLYIMINSLQLGQCISTCPQLYFTNSSQHRCQRCTDKNCLQCSQLTTGAQICTKCFNNHKLENNKCVASCQNAWPVLDVCQQCPYPCGNCTGQSDNNYTCFTCLDLYMLDASGMCVLRCTQGQYEDWNHNTCNKCPIQCKQCTLQTNTTIILCIQCNPNYTLHNTTCRQQAIQCPISTYLSNNTCLPCHSECLSCLQSQNRCNRCHTGKYLLAYSYECVDDCPYGYMNDYYNALCVVCTADCGGCTGMPYNCTSCANNYYRYYNHTTTYYSCIAYNQCQTIIGYYSNIYTNQCIRCPLPCIDCISQSICMRCDNGSYLFRDWCINQCSRGYYGYNSQCKPCREQCQSCTQYDTCNTCKINYLYHALSQQCLSVCKWGQYANYISMTCQPCNYPCETCINMEYCLSCHNDNISVLVLFKGQCLLQCPNGFYMVINNTRQCLPCNVSCYMCSSVNQCISCNFGYYLYTNRCLQSSQCPQKYYPDFNSRICALCQLPCMSCISKFQCKTCIDDYYLKQNSCYVSCPIGTYKSINGSCIGCQVSCMRCSQYQCNQCIDGMYLYKGDNNSMCIGSCPWGTYLLISQSICQACSQACQTCSERSDNCTSCPYSKVLENSRCIASCSNFYHQTLVNIVYQKKNFSNLTVCQRCNNSCYSCFSYQVCVVCDSSYLVSSQQKVNIKGILYNKSYCSQNCLITTFKDSQTFACMPCQPGCLICQSSSSCQQCSYQLGYVLYNIHCLRGPCPSNLYTIQGQNRCVQQQFCLVNSNTYYIYKKQRKCMKNCYHNLLMNSNNECVSQCNEGQLISFERVCVRNSNGLPIYSFSLYPIIKNGIIQIIITTGTKVNQNWINLFNGFEVVTGIDWKSNQGYRRLQESYSFKLIHPTSQPHDNALILYIVPQSPILQPNDLTVYIRMSDAYSNVINIEGFPLQNWQSSTSIPSYMVRQQEIGFYKQKQQGIRALPILLLVIAAIISCVNYIKSGKIYLLAPIWDFMSFLYLLNYLNVHWPLQMSLILDTFAVTWLKVFSIPLKNIVISPQKVHANATDMHLLRNIVCNFAIIGAVSLVYAILLAVKKLSKHQIKQSDQREDIKAKQEPIKILSRHILRIIFICIYLSIPNLLYFSLINLFYSNKAINIQSQSGFLYIQIPIIILISIMYLYVFQKQMKQRTYLDYGINPQKKKLIICLPVYIFARKLLIIIFMTAFYNNAAYPLCFALISTAFIFIMVCWFQPYNNRVRYILTLIHQALLFVFFLLCFIYACNEKQIMSTSYYRFIISLAIINILVTFLYPCYHLYKLLDIGTSLLKIKRSNPQAQINNDFEGICIEQLPKNKKTLKANQIPSQHNQDSAQCIKQKEKKEDNLSKINSRKKFKMPKDTLIQGQTDHQADHSSQQGERNKMKLADYTVRLIKRGAPVVKQFKNYDISQKSESNDDQNLAQKQIHLSKLIQQQNTLAKNRRRDSQRKQLN